jgi:hypothetical protein
LQGRKIKPSRHTVEDFSQRKKSGKRKRVSEEEKKMSEKEKKCRKKGSD